MKKALIIDYFKKSAVIWILLLLCVYCILACEFEDLRIGLFSIKKDVVFVDKLNNILKNISYSYIAGVIFFFLADTIPFLRRKKVVDKNVENTLNLMSYAIDTFSNALNGKKWDENTDVASIFEDVSGGEYSDNMPLMKLPKHIQVEYSKLANNLNTSMDFILSQELYTSLDLINDIEKIKLNKDYQFINSICNSEDENGYIDAKEFVNSLNCIIVIKSTISKYILC